MSLIRKHGAVLQAWACLDLVQLVSTTFVHRLYIDCLPRHSLPGVSSA